MDTLVQFYRWSLRVRPEVTRALPQHPECTPEYCGCQGCRNFIAAREIAYPPDFREKIALLGLDYRQETEVIDFPQMDGRVMYQGWFDFVGRVERGAHGSIPADEGQTFDFVPITKDFKVGIVAFKKEALPHEPRFLRLEFTALVPWLIEPPEKGGWFDLSGLNEDSP